MGDKLGVEVTPVDALRKAVEGLDLVVTSGPILKDPTPSIPAGWLAPGSFACPLDFDSYWTPEAFQEVDKLATDDLDQLALLPDRRVFPGHPRTLCRSRGDRHRGSGRAGSPAASGPSA